MKKRKLTSNGADEVCKEMQTACQGAPSASQTSALVHQWVSRLDSLVARLDEMIALMEQSKAPAKVPRSRQSAGARSRGWAPDGRPICYRCRQIGHLVRDCPARQTDLNNRLTCC